MLVVRMISGSAIASANNSNASADLLSKLSDKDLLRTQGYVGGEWRDAKDAATLDVCSINENIT